MVITLRNLALLSISRSALKSRGPIYFQSYSSSCEIGNILRSASAVCFDVDSTVSMEEGIDELAKFTGSHEEVVSLTSRLPEFVL